MLSVLSTQLKARGFDVYAAPEVQCNRVGRVCALVSERSAWLMLLTTAPGRLVHASSKYCLVHASNNTQVPTILLSGGCTYPGSDGGPLLMALETAIIKLQLQMEVRAVPMS